LDAIGFGQEFAAIKGVDEHLRGRGLKAANEMARKADADDGSASRRASSR